MPIEQHILLFLLLSRWQVFLQKVTAFSGNFFLD